MRTCHVVTLAYGDDDLRAQALYVAHSALAWAGDVELGVHLYVDRPASFRSVEQRAELHALTPERIREWQGPLRSEHRLKAKVIEDVVAAHPADPFLFVDAATFFVREVSDVFSRIRPGHAVMHAHEDPRTAARTIPGGDDVAWSAAAIGVDPAQCGAVARWVRSMEELDPERREDLPERGSIAGLLQREAELSRCDDAVFHYAFRRREYVARIREHLAALARLPPAMQADFLRARRIAPPPATRRGGILARLFGR